MKALTAGVLVKMCSTQLANLHAESPGVVPWRVDSFGKHLYNELAN
jgi:hypothetical protein